MGFLSHRRRNVEVLPEQKWDFISLNDFKHTSMGQPFAYAFLWFSLILSVVVYAVDIFTAYQLLALNKFTSQIEPDEIPFDIAKWIFSICIILSVVNLAYEYWRAITIMRRGSVAECFLDSLAARLESMRLGSGQGWKRFLVFAELTRSKKGIEYIALFTFFSFQSWIRVLFCAGPRQVINGFTIYSFYNKKLQIDSSSFEAGLSSFFDKIRALATQEPRQAVTLCGMLFTLIVWLFSFLSLLLAAFFFVFFLWHFIPREDGGLTGFCERKVNKRLKQIVAKKINTAMAEEERKRRKEALKAAKKKGEDRPVTMKPSLPVLKDDDLPSMPSISRTETFASFSEKASRPTTPGNFEMSPITQRPPMPSRTATTATAGSSSTYSSQAPLLSNAAEMGTSRPPGRTESPAPSMPSVAASRYPPSRVPTNASNYPPSRAATPASNGQSRSNPQPQRMMSNASSMVPRYTESPAPYSNEPIPSRPPPALSSAGPLGQYRGPVGPNPRWGPNNSGRRPAMDQYQGSNQPGRRPTMDQYQGPVQDGSRPTMDQYRGPSQYGRRPTMDQFQNHDPYGQRPTMDEYQNSTWDEGRPTMDGYGFLDPPMSPLGDRQPTLPNLEGGPFSQTSHNQWPSAVDREPKLPNLEELSRPGTAWDQELTSQSSRPTFDNYSNARASPAPSRFMPQDNNKSPFETSDDSRASPASSNLNAQAQGNDRTASDDYTTGRSSPAPSTFNPQDNSRSPLNTNTNGRASPAPSYFNPQAQSLDSSRRPFDASGGRASPVPSMSSSRYTRDGLRSLPSRRGSDEDRFRPMLRSNTALPSPSSEPRFAPPARSLTAPVSPTSTQQSQLLHHRQQSSDSGSSLMGAVLAAADGALRKESSSNSGQNQTQNQNQNPHAMTASNSNIDNIPSSSRGGSRAGGAGSGTWDGNDRNGNGNGWDQDLERGPRYY